jgi:hypothetical protein
MPINTDEYTRIFDRQMEEIIEPMFRSLTCGASAASFAKTPIKGNTK